MLHSVIPRKTPRLRSKRPHVVFAPDAATPLFVAEIPLLAAPCPPLASDLHQNAALFLALISARGPLIPMKKYQCVVCGYIYDEALGAPEDGIPAGTKWDDVPDTWLCPDCGVGKSDFEMVEI